MVNGCKSLSKYIHLIKGDRIESLSVVNKEEHRVSYIDNGMLMTSIEQTYLFNDDVIIYCRSEYDNTDDSDELCGEYWVSYEVKKGENIFPLVKRFHNRCQESFWLKMNK